MPDVKVDPVGAAIALLRARGKRVTRPRRTVLNVLAGDPGHVSVEYVVRAVAEHDPSIHRASVYRTLNELTHLGVVQHVHVGHGGTAYHLLRSEGVHLHASCTRCGVVIDLPPDMLRPVAARLAKDHGFALDPVHVALAGTCAGCRATGSDQTATPQRG